MCLTSALERKPSERVGQCRSATYMIRRVCRITDGDMKALIVKRLAGRRLAEFTASNICDWRGYVSSRSVKRGSMDLTYVKRQLDEPHTSRDPIGTQWGHPHIYFLTHLRTLFV